MTERFILYPSIVEPIETFPEQVHLDAWQQPLSLPRSQWAKILTIAVMASGAFMAPNPAPEAAHVDAWQPGLARQLLPSRAALQLGDVQTMFLPPPVFYQDAWARDLSTPPPPPRHFSGYEQFFPVNTAPEESHPDAWARDWPLPVRVKLRASTADEFFPVNTSPESVHSDAWARDLSQPEFPRRPRVATDQFNWPNPNPEAVHADAWARDLARPTLRILSRTPSDNFFVATVTVPTAFYQDAWARDLSLPRKPQRFTFSEEFFPVNTAPEAVHPETWGPLATPLYRISTRDLGEQFVPFVAPTPPADTFVEAWGNAIGQPIRSLPNIIYRFWEPYPSFIPPTPVPPIPPPPVIVSTGAIGPQSIVGPNPPGEVYISPKKGGKNAKGRKIRSDYPRWPGWGKW